MQHYKQYISILRDTFSSFTLLSDEGHDTLCIVHIVISSISGIWPNTQKKAAVRVDNAPGFQTLKNDKNLQQLYIEYDFVETKIPLLRRQCVKYQFKSSAMILKQDQ